MGCGEGASYGSITPNSPPSKAQTPSRGSELHPTTACFSMCPALISGDGPGCLSPCKAPSPVPSTVPPLSLLRSQLSACETTGGSPGSKAAWKMWDKLRLLGGHFCQLFPRNPSEHTMSVGPPSHKVKSETLQCLAWVHGCLPELVQSHKTTAD